MKRIVMCVLLSLCILYVGDYVSVRYRIPNNRSQFDVVKVRRYYAVGLKSGKTEYMFLPPENLMCVHSLFPHFGYTPCWYLSRRNVKRINM